MKTEFKTGDKVIGWDSRAPKKKVETFFLSKLEGVTPAFVCTAVGVTKDQVAEGKIIIRRFEFIEKAPVDLPPPKYKIGQRVKRVTDSYTEFGKILKIYTMSANSEIGHYHMYTMEGLEDEELEDVELSLPTDEELGTYFAC